MNNNKTSLAGLAQFISSLVFAIIIVVYALWTKTPLQTEAFGTAAFTVIFGVLSYVKGVLAADASNPVLRVAAKLFPDGEEKDVAKAFSKNITAAAETAVESYERPRTQQKAPPPK